MECPQNLQNPQYPQTLKKVLTKVVHYHDVQVVIMHFPGGKIQITPKLELCRANQDQIRNQGLRLRRNRLFLGRKAGVGV